MLGLYNINKEHHFDELIAESSAAFHFTYVSYVYLYINTSIPHLSSSCKHESRQSSIWTATLFPFWSYTPWFPLKIPMAQVSLYYLNISLIWYFSTFPVLKKCHANFNIWRPFLCSRVVFKLISKQLLLNFMSYMAGRGI